MIFGGAAGGASGAAFSAKIAPLFTRPVMIPLQYSTQWRMLVIKNCREHPRLASRILPAFGEMTLSTGHLSEWFFSGPKRAVQGETLVHSPVVPSLFVVTA